MKMACVKFEKLIFWTDVIKTRKAPVPSESSLHLNIIWLQSLISQKKQLYSLLYLFKQHWIWT